MQFNDFNFYFFFLGFIFTAILATASAVPQPQSDSGFFLTARYNHLFPKDTCLCEFDPEDPSKYDDCVKHCEDPSKRVYFTERDLSDSIRAICFCPFNVTNCNCNWPRPPRRCCGVLHYPPWVWPIPRPIPLPTLLPGPISIDEPVAEGLAIDKRDDGASAFDMEKREDNSLSTPVLHARACPPDGKEVCYYVQGVKKCLPCIEENVICPLEEEEIICLDNADGVIQCPPCRPRPRPIICPHCRHLLNGTIICPPCPRPTICPLFCIDYPNGTVVCPGCGDRPPHTFFPTPTFTPTLPTFTIDFPTDFPDPTPETE
ncbi:uncharacterized protein I303_104695 [Kwoniella dejecticola CBS 10117]|uniref:RING-type domain-containing protein n=1 Tax=Kwoniella dejecticola CBS 10117 TaxID=1296121 RepID=A0A1A6A4L7_9TREE|nr:uncharacterized protein I303_04326 [Kwoniella dejecticola CBS 10117]OBR84999.1 hypothetical protein I303_04326 [Kwoniella dejecticola CBS 10117]